MRILGYNILRGGGGREALLAKVIRSADADIVMLEEADRLASVAAIAGAAGYPYYNSRRGYSTAFMSRIPVDHAWHVMPQVRAPFLDVVPAGTDLHIRGVHLTSLLSRFTENIRTREIDVLLRDLNPARPQVLIGDFNTLAPGDTFDFAALPRILKLILRLSGGDIPRKALQRVLDAGYIDALRYLHSSEKGWSMPAWQPNTRLDYVFISPPLKDRLNDCRILTQPDSVRQASDHLPVLVEFKL